MAIRVLPQNRQGFNTALLRSEEEQLLLNIVRMQYSDRPYFLNVDNITASNALTISSNTTGYGLSKTRQSFAPQGYSIQNVYNIAPNVAYNDAPTVFYSPLQGEKFTRHILSPISMEDIYLLIGSGWSIARVLRITVQHLGDIPNAPGVSRPSTKHLPHYQSFVAFAHYLRRLELQDIIDLKSGKVGKILSLDIVPKKHYLHSAMVKKLYSMLNVNNKYDRIKLVIEKETDGDITKGNVLILQPRSFIGILYYLSRSVDISSDDIKKGLVIIPKTPHGAPFDWHDVTSGMMHIRSTSTQIPTNASVAVFYRDRWFYVADNDTDSKITMAMIEQLYSLHAGDAVSKGPLASFSLAT